MASDKDVLSEAKERFADAQDAWSHVRNSALEDLRFARLGEQWPYEIARQRQLESRPCLTINLLPPYIRQVVNDARQNKPTIRVSPVDSSADRATAAVFNGIIRHIERISDADIAYDTAIDCSVTQGLGFFYMDLDYVGDSTFDMDIFIRRVSNPQAVLFDAKSEAADSSDWRYAFITEMMDRAEFKRLYKGAQVSDWNGASKDSAGWFTQDQVRLSAYWSREETTRKILQLSNGEIVDAVKYNDPAVKALFDVAKVTVVRDREVKGYKVVHRIMSGADILETQEWAGKYIPVVPTFGDELNVDGKRYFQSLVHHAKDSQRNYNYWRSTETELVALAPKAPWVGEEEAFNVDGEAEKWATANTQSHAFLRYKKGTQAPSRQEFAGIPAGALQQSTNASGDLKATLGMHDAAVGAPTNDPSGLALLRRRKESDTSTFHFIDNLTRSVRCAGQILLDLIPQVYGPGRIARIIGEDGIADMVQLGALPQIPPNAPPEIAAQIRAKLEENAKATGLARIYDLGVGCYDVEAKAGPSYTTRREEASDVMLRLIQASPAVAPAVGSVLMKNLDFPDAEKIAARMDQLQAASQGNTGAPDVVGAAKVQADADITANREKLQAQVIMNREKLQAEAQMNREKLAAEAAMKREAAAASAAETTSKNLTSVVTTGMRESKHHIPQAPVPEFLQALPAFNPDAGAPAP